MPSMVTLGIRLVLLPPNGAIDLGHARPTAGYRQCSDDRDRDRDQEHDERLRAHGRGPPLRRARRMEKMTAKTITSAMSMIVLISRRSFRAASACRPRASGRVTGSRRSLDHRGSR